MLKVLILSYDFPPYVSVGGLRPYSWYNYFIEFGIYPVVITRQWSNKYKNHLDYIAPGYSSDTIQESTPKGEMHRTPYKPNLSNRIVLKHGIDKFKILRKIIAAYFELTQYLFVSGSKSKLYHEADQYLSNNKVDCIIATAEPFVLFKYASKLSKKYSVPWIADYRDPWSHDKARRKVRIFKFIDTFFERKFTSNASSVTTVSENFKLLISKNVNKPFNIIPNGYDQDLADNLNNIMQNTTVLSIGFIGTIHKWHPIRVFLSACNNLVNKGLIKLHLNFYGINIEEELKELIDTHYESLSACVSVYPKMSNEELLENLVLNNMFLLFNYYAYMGTKIYDYLALKRQILFCFKNDPEAKLLKEKYYNIDFKDTGYESIQENLLLETNTGIIVHDKDHLESVLLKKYKEFEEKGFILCDSGDISKYSRKTQVKRLAEIIKKIT